MTVDMLSPRCDFQSFSVVRRNRDSACASQRRERTAFMRHLCWQNSNNYSLSCKSRDQNRLQVSKLRMLHFSTTIKWSYGVKNYTLSAYMTLQQHTLSKHKYHTYQYLGLELSVYIKTCVYVSICNKLHWYLGYCYYYY